MATATAVAQGAVPTGGWRSSPLLPPSFPRGRATALYLFIINLAGFGHGPMLVAQTSDLFFRENGGIGTSLATGLPAGLFISAVAAAVSARLIRQRQYK